MSKKFESPKRLEQLGNDMVRCLEQTIEDLEFCSVDGRYTAKHIINVIGNALSGCIYGIATDGDSVDPAMGLAMTILAMQLIATEDEDVKQAYELLCKEKAPYIDLDEEEEDEDEEGEEWKKI